MYVCVQHLSRKKGWIRYPFVIFILRSRAARWKQIAPRSRSDGGPVRILGLNKSILNASSMESSFRPCALYLKDVVFVLLSLAPACSLTGMLCWFVKSVIRWHPVLQSRGGVTCTNHWRWLLYRACTHEGCCIMHTEPQLKMLMVPNPDQLVVDRSGIADRTGHIWHPW